MKKVEKGLPGYLDYKKKVEIIRTVIYFGIVAAIFFLGYFQTDTRLNLLTVVAVLGCLPASKALVGVIALTESWPKMWLLRRHTLRSAMIW